MNYLNVRGSLTPALCDVCGKPFLSEGEEPVVYLEMWFDGFDVPLLIHKNLECVTKSLRGDFAE